MKIDFDPSKAKAALRWVAELAKPIAGKAQEHAPELLFAAGTAGFVATCVSVAKASPKAKEAYERSEGMEATEVFLEVAPYYVPSTLLGALTLTCFFGSNRILDSRRAAVVAAYSVAERALAKYEEKVLEKLGEEGAADISEEVAKELADEDCAKEQPMTFGTMVPVGPGEKLYKDCVSQRFFSTKPETVASAEAEVNRRLNSEISVPLQEFYNLVGLEDDSPAHMGLGFENGRCPMDIRQVTVHKGTPIEYEYLYYDFVVVDRGYLDRPY